MRYLPFAFTQGSELARAIRLACEDPSRRSLCGTCGGKILIRPGITGRSVRCPHCWRWQQVTSEQEIPWRLSASAAEALRRTRRWVRL